MKYTERLIDSLKRFRLDTYNSGATKANVFVGNKEEFYKMSAKVFSTNPNLTLPYKREMPEGVFSIIEYAGMTFYIHEREQDEDLMLEAIKE